MVLAISIDREFHRNDSTIFPVVTQSGTADTPMIKFEDWQYFEAPSGSFSLQPPNRSKIDATLRLRNCFLDTANWDIPPSEPGHVFGIDILGNFTRSGGTSGWEGFYYTIPLTGEVISIQATAASLATQGNSAGISLQDTQDPVPFPFPHNYFTDTVIKHAIILGQNGQLTIREETEKPKGVVDFEYEVDDTVMIELDTSLIVRYYLIKPSGQLILLRTTLSKLTTDPTAEVMLYADAAQLNNVLLCDGTEAETTFENIGVARRAKGEKEWQKWENQRSRMSNAIPIQLADGEFEYTFPSSKRVLRQHNLTPKTYNNAGFQAFEDFFNWHGNEKNFIFVDEARKNDIGDKQEFWARFAGPMTDSSKNACLFDYGVPLIEAYRGDFIPRVTDETAPVIELASNSGTAEIARFVATATDNQAVDFVRFYIDGRHIFNLDVYSGTDDYEIAFGTDGIDSGDYDITAVAYDIAGNTTTSNIETLTVA